MYWPYSNKNQGEKINDKLLAKWKENLLKKDELKLEIIKYVEEKIEEGNGSKFIPKKIGNNEQILEMVYDKFVEQMKQHKLFLKPNLQFSA